MNDFDINITINELIFSSVSCVTSVEYHKSGKAEIFIRENGKLNTRLIDFSPFLIASDSAIGESIQIPHATIKLNGTAFFKYLLKFDNLEDYESAVAYLKKNMKLLPTSPNSPYRLFTDIQQQILISLNIRLFRNMKYSDIRRFQFDIETLTTKGFDFSNSERPDDKIIVISMRDSTGWEKCLVADDNMTEKDILEGFVSAVKERDPDVLEGHNVFRFDLPFIETRAKMMKVKLNLGRDGSVIKSRNSRFSAAEKTTSYKRYEVYGRHIVDTYFLAQLYDVSHRNLESYGLKSLAIHFNVASKDRSYIDVANIEDYYKNNREELLKYALDDVRETDAISRILSPSFFHQAQLQPFSYQNIITRGNASRIDAMLVGEYISKKESFGLSDISKSFEGALTEAFESGIFENVWHCDIRSLYPSIMISEDIKASSDTLGVFSSFLSKLRDIRLNAKDMEKASKNSADKDSYNSMQTAFKILINSFYGYLAFSQGTFNDYSAAERVTRRGREILTMMLNYLQKINAKVIEMDTDGIYFQPPLNSSISPAKLESDIQNVLPEGIEVELDSIYKKMFCYKSKNYALLSEDGEMSITGAALKSRGVEPFIRAYLKDIIRILLCSDGDELKKVTDDYKYKIETSAFPLSKLSKSETLSESPEGYKAKITQGTTRRSAAYELALKSNRGYKQGDQIAYYVVGNKKKVSVVDNCQLLKDAPEKRNENTAYYIQKIDELYTKFKPFMESESDQLEFRLE
ncbi:MAG: DNA polymerase domain-containing protein [Lentisphaerota bacterium]